MIQFSVNKSTYKLNTTWQEITIQQAIDLTEIGMPDYLQTKLKEGGVGLSDFMVLDGLQFAKKSVSVLAGIPEKELDKTHAGDVLNLFAIVLPLIIDLYNVTPQTYIPKMITEFTYKGETFLMPQSKVFNGVFVPGTDLDSVSFVESANLMAAIGQLKEKGLASMPALVACYCKKPGEVFDQFVIMERAEAFRGLPMSVAWEVFFYMAQSLHTAMSDMLTYLKAAVLPQKETFRSLVSGHFRRGYMQRLKRDMETGKRLN